MTVREMLARMDSRELAEWMAFDSIEPIGQRRGDYQAAVVAQTVAEVNRDTKRRSKPYRLLDFMPFVKGAERVQTDWKAIKAAWKARFGRG